MKITEGLRESFDVIRGNKVRSFLTILGINFGVGCLIAISVVGLGFRFSIESELGRYGSTLLWVQVSWRAYAGNEPRIQMDDRDIEYFKTALPGVESGESIFDISYPVATRAGPMKPSCTAWSPPISPCSTSACSPAGRYYKRTWRTAAVSASSGRTSPRSSSRTRIPSGRQSE
jgi:hypothetical protein